MFMSHSQLQISKANLFHNFRFFQSKLSKSTKLLILVKANGYGHGDIEISKLVEEFGANYLGVAYPSEGIRLKKAGIKLPILVLTPGYNNFEEIIEHNLEPSIIDLDAAENFVQTLAKSGKATYNISIKCDTGMQRVGFNPKSAVLLAEFLKRNSHIKVNTIFSHLAAADDPKHDQFTLSQIAEYEEFYSQLTHLIGYKPIKHILNSSGIERFTQYQFDMVRLGVGLYGTSYVDQTKLKPAASLVAPIVQIKHVTDGTIGYGRHGLIDSDKGKTIASIPLGYADGIDRHLGRGKVSFYINGKPAPTIGNICMDMFMLDITGIDAKAGDMVTIFGEKPNASELADILGTISYEIFTSVSQRVKRVVVD